MPGLFANVKVNIFVSKIADFYVPYLFSALQENTLDLKYCLFSLLTVITVYLLLTPSS